MVRRNAESGSHESIGSQKWIVKTIVIVAALALGWAGSAVLRRIDKLEITVEAQEKAVNDNKSKIERLEDRLGAHGHTQDPKVGELDRRVERIERPRPWERQPSGRR